MQPQHIEPLEISSDPSADLHARVAALAYSFYERRGRAHGQDVEDWVQAEQTILGAVHRVADNTKESSRRVAKENRRAKEKTKRG